MSEREEWLEWQRRVIHSAEYKDLTVARENAEKSIRKTVKQSLKRVKRYVH